MTDHQVDAPKTDPANGSVAARTTAWARKHARVAVWANLIGQIGIIVTGGLVRLTGSGLGCSTWPMCEPGQFTPVHHDAMTYHPYVEFGNRTMSGVLVIIGLFVVLAVATDKRRTARYRALGWVPVIGVLLQALIGGLTVLVELHPAVVGFHMLISIALVAISAYLVARQREGDASPSALLDRPTTRVARGVVAWFMPVVALGVLVTGSGPHSGDEEIGYRFALDPAAMARIHALSVWVLLIGVIALTVMVLRRDQPNPAPMRRALKVLWALIIAEGAVGYTQFFTGLPVALVAVHMLLAAALTAAAVFALVATRQRPAAA